MSRYKMIKTEPESDVVCIIFCKLVIIFSRGFGQLHLNSNLNLNLKNKLVEAESHFLVLLCALNALNNRKRQYL